MNRGATLSICGRYRYRLWRRWGEGGKDVCFMMLNPSTADANKDDATIRKCIGFARLWGYHGIQVVNLFGLRATQPIALLQTRHPVDHTDGSANFDAIHEAVTDCEKTIAAWGAWGVRMKVNESMLTLLEQTAPGRVFLLHRNKDGSPKHPLYCPYNSELKPLDTPPTKA